MPAGFRISSANNARLVAAGHRFRGGPTEETLACHLTGVRPRASLDPHVVTPAWAGHQWSPWHPLTATAIARVPAGTGLYRIRGRTGGLLYIGEGRIRDRLRIHLRKLIQHTPQGRVLVMNVPLEYSTVFDDWRPHQRLELETDLIAAHTLAFGAPPTAQFIG